LPFAVHLTDADKAYLDNLPLSARAKAHLTDFIDYALAKVDAAFRTDPDNRMGPNQSFFKRAFLLVDAWGDDRWHRIEFVVDDAHAGEGKLVVVFIDHQDGEWTW
jgi:hypothetical protein